MRPGALPATWGMMVAPWGTSAWRALFSVMVRPRASKKPAMTSTIAWSRTSGTFMTSAMASRVMSSWVGPSPPHMMTPSRRASVMRSWLSPTAWWKWDATPLAARCSPSQAELVSAIWPSNNSVPTATISILTAATLRGGGTAQHPTPVEQVLGAGEERQCAGEPDRGQLQRVLMGQRRNDDGADRQVLHQRLDLRRFAGRDGHAAPADPGAVKLHAHLADRDEDHGQPGQVALHAERDHGGEHAGLVGQGVEEGTRTGGAVATGHVAIEPVARGKQETHDDVDPRGAPGHQHEHVDRRGQEPGHRDGVGRRDQGAGP